MIILDDYGHETYSSFTEFCEVCGNEAALEYTRASAELDALIGLNGISTTIIEKLDDLSGMESIKDKVANMASKAKSNIVLWAKKFINFFFGWIINFFKGVVNIRKSLKSGFEKAKTYLKELEKLAPKMGKANSDTKIEITDAAPNVIRALSTVLLTSLIIKDMGEVFKIVSNKSKESNAGDVVYANSSLKLLTSVSVALGLTLTIIDPTDSNPESFYNTLKQNSFDLTAWFDKSAESVEPLVTKFVDAESGKQAKNIWQKFKDLLKGGNINLNELTKEEDDYVKESAKKVDAVLKNSAEKMGNLEPREFEINKAYFIIKEGLLAFLNISEKNKSLWNFEKNVQTMEKIRRSLLSSLDTAYSDAATTAKSENAEKANSEDAIKELMSKIIAAGSLFDAAAKNANKMMSHANKCIDTLITDTAKLGSAVIKIGG